MCLLNIAIKYSYFFTLTMDLYIYALSTLIMSIQTNESRFLVKTYQWDRSTSVNIDTPSKNITEILLTLQVNLPVFPHNPQHITYKDKFVCHLVVNNVFKTRSISARAVLIFFDISSFSALSICFKKSKLPICFVLDNPSLT